MCELNIITIIHCCTTNQATNLASKL